MSESKLQQACVRWFRYQYPDILIFAIPNGGQRNKVTASILKAEGVLAGVPDLFIANPNATHSGLFIEMKFGNNKPTQLQRETMTKLQDSGYDAVVCCSFDGFVEAVENYINNKMIF
jgi:hypothetical protein